MADLSQNPDVNPDGTLRLLSMLEASRLYPISVRSLSKAINDGELETVTPTGARKYLMPSTLNAWFLSKRRRYNRKGGD
jgi:hypothetical protein